MQELLVESGTNQTNQVWFAHQGQKLAVFHHGVPRPQPLSPAMLSVFADHGFSVACVVRRGYLGSSSTAPAPMVDDAEITDAVVKHLGYTNFISVGYSGGGARALADACALAACDEAITFGSVAPIDQGFDALGLMSPEDREFAGMIQQQGMGLLPKFEEWKVDFARTTFEDTLPKNDPAVDAWLKTPDAIFRSELPTDLPFRSGASGWLLDEISMVSPWGFSPDQIVKPVQLVSGTDDRNVSPENSKWLAEQIKSSRLFLVPGYEHNRVFCTELVREALNRLV